MIFTTEQIKNILTTVDLNSKYLAAEILGTDILSEQDLKDLEFWGFDIKKIENSYPTFLQAYYWGKLSELIGDYNAGKINYNDFTQYLKKGQYQPLTNLEKYSLEAAKNRTYRHITGLGEGMKNDFQNILTQTELERREEYEKVIKKELEKGVADRKSLNQIVSELGHKSSDWDRNWGRIVDTEMNNIFQEGRAAQIKQKESKDALVYKDVYPEACRHCIKAYLTNGLGSKPKVFKLSELEANGTNIGKKVIDWKPVIHSTHPHCRCTLHKVIKGQEWNEETKQFEFPKNRKRKDYGVKAKIIVHVGNKKFEV